MRTRSVEQNLALMPDGMAKRVYLKILNTPKPDFTELEKENEEYVKMRFAQMTEEERALYENAK